MKLEGIVSKCRDAPYRSGKQCGWVKVKCENGYPLRDGLRAAIGEHG
jgi:ATP-dependent DNA ligase